MLKLLSTAGLLALSLVMAAPAQAADAVQLSHRVFNDTKNKDAANVLASREDYLTYTLTTTNISGVAMSNYVLTFDASGVLPLADVVDLGGGVLNGQTIAYTGLSLNPGQTLENKLRVRVKAFLPEYQYVVSSSYGNTNLVTIEAKGVVAGAANMVTPRTGGVSMLPWIMGLVLAGGYGMMKRYKLS